MVNWKNEKGWRVEKTFFYLRACDGVCTHSFFLPPYYRARRSSLYARDLQGFRQITPISITVTILWLWFLRLMLLRRCVYARILF